MSTNRVGDGKGVERRLEDGRRDKRQHGAKREQRRSFSQMMEKKQMPAGDRRGDERGRKLREGKVQSDSSRERAAQTQRRHSTRMQSSEKKGERSETAKIDRRQGRRDADERPGEARTGDDKSGEECRHSPDGGGLSMAAEELRRGTDDAVREVQSRVGGSEDAQSMEASKGKNMAIAEVARQIVEAVRVGEDGHLRRVVFLDVTVPGRGDIRIRLRRDGGAMEVRMRAGNDGLARSLREGVGELRQRGAEKGIQFTSIQVVR